MICPIAGKLVQGPGNLVRETAPELLPGRVDGPGTWEKCPGVNLLPLTIESEHDIDRGLMHLEQSAECKTIDSRKATSHSLTSKLSENAVTLNVAVLSLCFEDRAEPAHTST